MTAAHAAGAWLASPVNALVTASAAASMTGNALIWRGTWAGRDKPVVASWAEWAALMAIGAAAAAMAGQMPAAVFGTVCALGCAVVAPLALRIPAADRDPPVRVLRRVTYDGKGARLDLLLLPGVLAGLMLLASPLFPAGRDLIRTQGPAVAVTVATDALAYVPTIAHAWRHPASEPWKVYALFGAGAAASLAAVALQGQMLNMAAVAYPLYLAAADLGAALLILARRRAALPEPAAEPWPPGYPPCTGPPLPCRACPRRAGLPRCTATSGVTQRDEGLTGAEAAG